MTNLPRPPGETSRPGTLPPGRDTPGDPPTPPAERKPAMEKINISDETAETIRRYMSHEIDDDVDHIFEGDCPDDEDDTRRDPKCPACRVLLILDHARNGFQPGDRFRVLEDHAYNATVRAGDTGTIAKATRKNRVNPTALAVIMDSPRGNRPVGDFGGHWWLRREDIEYLPSGDTAAPEAVETAWKLGDVFIVTEDRAYSAGVSRGDFGIITGPDDAYCEDKTTGTRVRGVVTAPTFAEAQAQVKAAGGRDAHRWWLPEAYMARPDDVPDAEIVDAEIVDAEIVDGDRVVRVSDHHMHAGHHYDHESDKGMTGVASNIRHGAVRVTWDQPKHQGITTSRIDIACLRKIPADMADAMTPEPADDFAKIASGKW